LEVSLNSSSNATEQQMARITCTGMMVDVDFYSALAIQNLTLAAAGADVNDELSTNVENNPLKGRIYRSTRMSNGLVPKYKPNTSTATFQNMIADNNTGAIVENASNMGSGLYAKPPDPYFLTSTAASLVFMQPCHIKKDTINVVNRMNIDRFSKLFGNAMWRNANQANPYVDCWIAYGIAHVIALEKVLDSGSSEQNIRLGYELTQTYKVKLDYKNDVCVPNIQTGL